MGGRTFERKAPFATTSFKKGCGCTFKGGLIFGDYSTYVAQEGYKICQLKTSCGTSFPNISMLICRDNCASCNLIGAVVFESDLALTPCDQKSH